MVLSMKFRLYVMNMRGMRRQSILRKTRCASAFRSTSTCASTGGSCVAVAPVRLEVSMMLDLRSITRVEGDDYIDISSLVVG